MKIIGSVEEKINGYIEKQGTICAGLIDSENSSQEEIQRVAKTAEKCGVKLILVGGSTIFDQNELNKAVKTIKKNVKIPVVLFPGNSTGVVPSADAILFSSLLNSQNPYFITGAQAISSLSVKNYKLEAIPMGYISVGEGGTMGFIGQSRGIPASKPKLAAMYALAAQYLGMRYIYLEAGSGVISHISPEFVKVVKSVYTGKLIVGGGIKNKKVAKSLALAGADIIVIGTLLEQDNFQNELSPLIKDITNVKK